MTQLVLPHSIDAGTEVVAAEHQQNYVAVRDVINGNLEGGSGVAGNMKAKGLTGRELDAVMMKFAGVTDQLQPGVFVVGDLKVTAGAGLNLNIAAGRGMVLDGGALHTSGVLIPASYAGGSVAVAANASGNPRIDQIILTLTGYDVGTVSVLQGAPQVGATLDNRSGAAALPAGTIRLADILMPNAFAGPFVAGTHIRDRRRWSKGAFARATVSAAYTNNTVGFTDVTGWTMRLETGPNPVEIMMTMRHRHSAAHERGGLQVLNNGGAVMTEQFIDNSGAAATTINSFFYQMDDAFTEGSHLIVVQARSIAAGTLSIDTSGGFMIVRERVGQIGSND